MSKKVDFLNPFEEGVTYADFTTALNGAKVADYCKGKLTQEEIEFIEKELSILKK